MRMPAGLLVVSCGSSSGKTSSPGGTGGGAQSGVVTIANTLSQPVMRESGVLRLPQTIRGLFDAVQPARERDRDRED